jgi:hypothetical protein
MSMYQVLFIKFKFEKESPIYINLYLSIYRLVPVVQSRRESRVRVSIITSDSTAQFSLGSLGGPKFFQGQCNPPAPAPRSVPRVTKGLSQIKVVVEENKKKKKTKKKSRREVGVSRTG